MRRLAWLGQTETDRIEEANVAYLRGYQERQLQRKAREREQLLSLAELAMAVTHQAGLFVVGLTLAAEVRIIKARARMRAAQDRTRGLK